MSNQKTSFQVLLRQRMIVADGLAFTGEREVTLPIQPFVGLSLYNTCRQPPGSEANEESIEEIAYDLKTRLVICYLPLDDFRNSNGFNNWTETEVRELYSDWTLKRDEPAGQNRSKTKVTA